MKKKNSVLRKVLAVALSAVTVLGTGFTTVGQFASTDVSVSAAETLTYGDFQYSVNNDNTITIIKYAGKDKDVDIPDVISGKIVTAIGNSSFSYCNRLVNVKISTRATVIGDGAFAGCENLVSVTMPDKLKSIGRFAFNNCYSLKNIKIPDSVTDIGNSAFHNCNSLTEITIPNGVTDIWSETFSSCENLIHLKLGNNLKSINAMAFERCISLTNVSIPNGVISIKDAAFSYCENLNDIDIPNTVQSIGTSAFYGCYNLKHLIIPSSVERIYPSAFSQCTGLKVVTIKNGVERIDSDAFLDCNNLNSIYIPDSVNFIGYKTFYNCNNLVIFSNEGSEAERYATENNIAFKVPQNVKNNATISSSTILLGENITIKAKASGGNGYYTYAALYKKKADTSWIVKQNYSTNDIIVIKPEKATDYDVCVKVKDSITDDIVKKYFTVKVTGDPIENTSKISAGTIQAGDTVTINCSAKGGNGNYKYSVQYKKQSEQNWISTMGFATVTTMPLKFSQVGKYDISVKVRDDIGNTKEKIFTVNVIDKLENNSKISATTINIGKTITVTGSASGGIGEYQYQILYKQTAQSSWTKAQDFNTNSVVTFKPAKATTYDVCVKVKDSNGTIVKKFFTVQVNAKLTNTSAVSATTIKKGDTVAVNGSATGGVGDYTYAVYYKQKAQTKWTVKQDFNENSDVSVKPAQATDYDICVKVKDKDGTIVKKYFTVTVTK